MVLLQDKKPLISAAALFTIRFIPQGEKSYKIVFGSETIDLGQVDYRAKALVICVDAGLFRAASELCVDDRITYIQWYQNSKPEAIDGFYIACVQRKEDNRFIVFCNAATVEQYMALCGIFGQTISGYIHPYLENMVGSLKETVPASVSGQDLLLDLFESGTIAVACDSKEEYIEAMENFRELGYAIDVSVNPEGWNDVCKYLHVKDLDGEMAFIKASHRLMDDLDSVYPYSVVFREAEEEKDEADIPAECRS